ncbi:ROK family glucokinase [Virgibacillus halodenitrificans]|uniref:Glucokinase n=1 Tax=Virgibacillus halodenitrificans TaxID=1482 RepID=A0AAC9IZ56_VIRHA|nr:ROK family glucokinase [Virgibacillus halodenitrificans]APC48257.1 glucokinase [Virgibacillus halodenitrificans]MCG1029264.1 ROK family glucokinase [Virgibacillus halodenitrificans]MEC2158432.1 ROK family glucokinase [Virgibacillus halodenitrificans]
MSKYILGVDIGGTSVKIGIITNEGDIRYKWEIPTVKTNGGNSILSDLWSAIETKLQDLHINKRTIIGIGVGAPGFIDGDTGFIHEAVNIGWKNYRLAEILTKLSGLPVYLENDANIAVLGENWKGAGNQATNLLAITLGTGVGGGIIANGKIINGENGMAGEIGHITVDKNGYQCNCGRVGCLETVASATGIVRQAMDVITHDKQSRMAEHYMKTGVVTAKDIFIFAEEGDKAALKIVRHTADVLGLLISNLGTIINPSKVLIGGGVSKAGDTLINEIKMAFEKYALKRVSDICEIKTAKLGNDAGIIGAAFLVKQKKENLTF